MCSFLELEKIQDYQNLKSLSYYRLRVVDYLNFLSKWACLCPLRPASLGAPPLPWFPLVSHRLSHLVFYLEFFEKQLRSLLLAQLSSLMSLLIHSSNLIATNPNPCHFSGGCHRNYYHWLMPHLLKMDQEHDLVKDKIHCSYFSTHNHFIQSFDWSRHVGMDYTITRSFIAFPWWDCCSIQCNYFPQEAVLAYEAASCYHIIVVHKAIN